MFNAVIEHSMHSKAKVHHHLILIFHKTNHGRQSLFLCTLLPSSCFCSTDVPVSASQLCSHYTQKCITGCLPCIYTCKNRDLPSSFSPPYPASALSSTVLTYMKLPLQFQWLAVITHPKPLCHSCVLLHSLNILKSTIALDDHE